MVHAILRCLSDTTLNCTVVASALSRDSFPCLLKEDDASMQAAIALSMQQADDDLEKAIAASIQEHSTTGSENVVEVANSAISSEDADLARAIAASMQAASVKTDAQNEGSNAAASERSSGEVGMDDEDEDEDDDDEEVSEDDDDDILEYNSAEDDDFGIDEAMQMDTQDETAPNGISVHEHAQQLMSLAGMEDIEQAKKCD